MAEFELEPTG